MVTIGGNSGEESIVKRNSKTLGNCWKCFITPTFGQKIKAAVRNAKIIGVTNKTYNGLRQLQNASSVVVFVGNKRLKYGKDYKFEYAEEEGQNYYRRPTEGKGAWFYIAGAGSNYRGYSPTLRYKIIAPKAYLLQKDTKKGFDYRITRSKTAADKLQLNSGYNLISTMHTRSSSFQPVFEYYNQKLKLHRYTFLEDIGKRLVNCGYKKGNIVAFSDPSSYADYAGKLYAANYYNKSCKTQVERFQYTGYACNYGSLKEADSEMLAKYGCRRSFEIIEYVRPHKWK